MMNHHDEFNAHAQLLASRPMKAFKAHIAAMGKPTFAFTIHAIDWDHALAECDAMLLAGDSLTLEALS